MRALGLAIVLAMFGAASAHAIGCLPGYISIDCPPPGAAQPPPSAHPTEPAVTPPVATQQSESYRRGIVDWRELKAWVETQAGDRRAGADYWSANRSVAGRRSCVEAATGDKVAFIAGCQEAKRRLDPIDDQRRNEPQYRAGFAEEATRLPIAPISAPPSRSTVTAPTRMDEITYETEQEESCKTASSPTAIVVCGDADLRALALDRKKAYDAAQWRSSVPAGITLHDNQKAWGNSYAEACGIAPDAAPVLPLAPKVKECMLQAGRARLSYLREYAAPSAAAPPTATISTEYRAMLAAWLESHKRYPESARQRGEEGRATLRFHVDRSGRVLDYAVVGSTGYADLDAAAQAMMRGAVLPAFPPGMTASDVEVSVTINFGLTTGTGVAPPSAGAPVGDPLLDAVHKVMVKRARDFCSPALAAESCKDPSNGYQVSPGCLKAFASQCPNGPDKIVIEWEANRAASTVSFKDFILDKEQMVSDNKSVIIRGTYIRAPDSMDYLLESGKINPQAYGRTLDSDTAIPLLIDDHNQSFGTSREARAALLTCREKYPPVTLTGCNVMLSGFVQRCTITMQLTNASHESVCVKVTDVIVDPRS